MAESMFKVGDQVAVVATGSMHQQAPRGPFTVQTINRRSGNVTLQGNDKSQYSGATGYRRGDSWSRLRIEPWSTEHAEAIQRANCIAFLARFSWDRLPTSCLANIVGMAKANLPKPAEQPPATNSADSGPTQRQPEPPRDLP